MMVVKNKLLREALRECGDFSQLEGSMKGSTTVLFSNVGNAPAKLIKEFTKKAPLPALKAAYVEESFYIGADQLDTLVAIKSKTNLLPMLLLCCNRPPRTLFLLCNRPEVPYTVCCKHLQNVKFILKSRIINH